MAVNLLLLVGTVLLAIAQVFLLCLAGYILARMDILNKQTRKQVNRLNTSIFTPALLFTKVAYSLTATELKQLWIIPILFIIVTAVSAGVAYLMGLVCRVKPEHRYFAMAAAMFMNSNSMPIALMQSLIGTVSELKWNESDTPNSMLARSLTYLVLYSTLGNIARWSFGVKILERADASAQESTADEKKIDVESQQPAKEIGSAGNSPVESCFSSDVTVTAEPGSNCLGGKSDSSTFYSSDEARLSVAGLPRVDAGVTEEQVLRAPLFTRSSSTLVPHTINATSEAKDRTEPEVPTPPLTKWQRFVGRLKRFWTGFYDFMTMPLWAALLSIIIALIPPVQNVVSNYMPPVRKALEAAGDCSIPLTLVVLGAYFYTPLPKGTVIPPLKERLRNALRFRRSTPSDAAPKAEKPMRTGEKRTILISIISRQVLCPLIVLPLMLVFIHFNVPRVFSDPVFVVSNVLLVSAPIALTLAQMSSKTGASDGFERLLSTTIFYAYCIVLTPITIVYIIIGLILAKM
ncbi:uncharacterized protein FOMMEDRAFT_170659 [Fomitiporia mediterranea MF3/22]|uniref:uncharacterized protein n=1 Tax=Fomitiporia mediterranea (strain MF3/22) TaxID=694068 RepID=UPI00044093A1|nr:uncharacterized protein FOMMEDRAFT_170659 [Fomitiporia mediterranea MF3/22]EJC99382.1 hypothetical protein FOMMEDRAFT_170659 [Fomitiporia mediterranea MF3/22]